MPSFLAHTLFTSIDTFFNLSKSILPFIISLLSMIPVRDTPSKDSSSVFCFHLLVKYLKFVSVAWNVPRTVAASTLAIKVSSLSSGLTTTSVKLQNCLLRRIISLHGLHPKSLYSSLLPFLDACFSAACLLNIPRSPLLDS